MNKQAVSVTLGPDNLMWLRGRAKATGVRSISELLDQLVTSARRHGQGRPRRSVVGAIAIDRGDPELLQADAALRALFDESVARPFAVHESAATYSSSPRRKKKAGA
jgi:hypothetical protein